MKHIVETHCNEESILHFAQGWGWTYSGPGLLWTAPGGPTILTLVREPSAESCLEFQRNLQWVEDLIRNYHNDQERAVLWCV